MNIWVGSGGQEVGRRIIKEVSRWSDGRRKVRWSKRRRMQRIGRPDGGRRLAEAIPLGSSREGEMMFTGKQQNEMEYTQIDSICVFILFSSYLAVCLFWLQVNNAVQPRRSFQPTDGRESLRRLLKFCFQIPCKHTAAEHNRYYTVLR